jgi:hypothetical protein
MRDTKPAIAFVFCYRQCVSQLAPATLRLIHRLSAFQAKFRVLGDLSGDRLRNGTWFVTSADYARRTGPVTIMGADRRKTSQPQRWRRSARIDRPWSLW